MRLHLEEGLADSDEAGDVQHPSWVEVLQLQAPLIEESAQKPVHGISKPMLMEGEEGDNLAGPRMQKILPRGSPPVRHLLRWQHPLLDEGSQH